MLRMSSGLLQSVISAVRSKLHSNRIPKPSALLLLGMTIAMCGALTSSASAQSATATALAVTAGGSPASSVAVYSMVTLTATVTSGGSPVTPGLVQFCDVAGPACSDVHLLGSVQLNSSGTAVFRFRPATGAHTYKAVFVGTTTHAASTSSTATLTVTTPGGQYPSAADVSATGQWGSYSLTATVQEFGGITPITGTVSFQDTNNGNAVLATAPLGTNTSGLFWGAQAPCMDAAIGNITIAADFDGDGYPDLATVNGYNKAVQILRYKPSYGCYYQSASYATGNSPYRPVVADFNSDGNLDLAIPNTGSDTLTILLGHGDGTFTASTVSLTGIVPYSLGVADFNGDGKPDLVVSPANSDNSVILLGNGDGTFTSVAGPSLTSVNAVLPAALTPGDFNGDGKIDVVVPTTSGFAIYAGKGDGTFNSTAIVSSASVQSNASLFRLAFADFNQDGKLDIALASGTNVVPQAGQFQILLGNGDGTFQPGGVYTTPDGPLQLEIADFNLDGNPDLAVLDLGSNITVLPGNGDGTFSRNPYTSSTGVSPSYQNFALGDMDGDGRPDILYPAPYPPPQGPIALYFRLTMPTLTASTAPVAIAPSSVGQHLVVANYPGDANTTSAISNPVTLWGSIPPTATSLTVTANGTSVSKVSAGTAVTLTASVTTGGRNLTTGQVNFCDASASYCTDQYLLGTARLTAGGTATYKFVPGPGNHSYKAVFPLNGYGASSSSNIVVLSVTGGTAGASTTATTIAQSGSIGNYTLTATVIGNGSNTPLTGNVSFLDTSFANSVLATSAVGSSTPGLNWNPLSSNAFTNVAWLVSVAGDFNGDGIPDLAIVNQNSMAVAIRLGNGDGTFTANPDLALTTYPAALVTGDFNGDGKLDLAVSSTGPNYNSPGTLTIFLGVGNGSFTVANTTSGVATIFAATDFNGDGKLDLLTNSSTQTNILFGNGDGTFNSGSAIGSFKTLAVADVNRDGVPDLLVNNFLNGDAVSSGIAQVYLGNGDGTFRAGSILPSSAAYSVAAIGDFNGDGIPDLVTISGYYTSPAVFLGKGDGSFTQVTSGATLSINEPLSIALADINSDGKLDMAITNANSYSNSYNPDFAVFLGNGDGTFIPVEAIASLGSTAYAVAADFNGDGKPELAMQANTNLVVLQPIPTQTATATATGISPAGPAPHLVAAKYLGDSNYSSSTSGTTSLDVQVATPVVSPSAGTYSSGSTITITDATPGATIYYQGSGPIYTNGYVQYTGPIPIYGSGSGTLSVYASESGYQQSSTVTGSYTFNFSQITAAPTFSLAPGVYSGSQQITMTSATPGAAILYTTNGTTPSIYATVYSGPITISGQTLLKAIAVAPGYSISSVTSAEYLFSGTTTSLIYTIAGNGMQGHTGDGGLATQAQIGPSLGMAYDATGNLYFSDSIGHSIRRVDASTGIITTIAGTGVAGFGGDGGPATKAQLYTPAGLVFDSAGNLYIADYGNNRVRKIDATSGIITTALGGGTLQLSGGGSTQLLAPRGLAFDSSGNLYVAYLTGVIKVSAPTNAITQVVNTNIVAGVAVDHTGNIFFLASSSLYEIPVGTNANYLPLSSLCILSCLNAAPGTARALMAWNPQSIAVDSAGNLYIADNIYSGVLKFVPSTITLSNVTLRPAAQEAGDGGFPGGAGLVGPISLAFDANGNLAIADQGYRVRKIVTYSAPPATTTSTPSFSLAAGTYDNPQVLTIRDDTPAASIYYTLDASTPTSGSGGYFGPINITGTVTVKAIAIAQGALTSAEASNTYTVTAPPAATISTFVARPSASSLICPGTQLTGIATWMIQPQNVAVDPTGYLYVSDYSCNAVWKIAAQTGALSVIAGTGAPGRYPFSGDGGPATSAKLFEPRGIALDGNGNLYIADFGNNRVRKVDAATGIITTVAGNGSTYYTTNNGDGGPATSATLLQPIAVSVDPAGNLYISDSARVREVAAATGVINTIAGNGTYGYSGDGGPGISAQVGSVTGLSFDHAGNLYLNDSASHIRKVAASSGIITTVAGSALPGFAGDGGPALNAQIYASGMTVDPQGNLYLSNINLIRLVSAADGTITTIAGSGIPGYWGDGGSAAIAGLNSSMGLALDGSGNLFIVDSGNLGIRKVTFATNPGQAPPPTFSPAAGTYIGTQNVIISDTAPGSTIYYTTDRSTPTTSSTVYSAPISVSSNQTLKAIAVAPGYYASATATASYIILTAQTITFTPLAGPVTYGVAPLTLSATASSGLPITFSVVSGPGTISNTILSISGAGTVIIAAIQAGDSTYAPAEATQTLTILRGTPAITWTAPSSILAGTNLSGILTASASYNSTVLSGSFSYTATPSGGSESPVTASTVLQAGNYALKASFTPTDANNYNGASATGALVVTNPTPSIATLSPAITRAGGANFTLTVTGTGFVTGSTVYWGTTALPTILVSGTQLQATVSAASIASAGTANVAVQTPAPGGGSSGNLQLEIDSANSSAGAPVFTTITGTVTAGQSVTYPVTLPSSASNVSINCLNLPSGATCTYSASTSSVTIATASTTPAGTYQVTVVFTETITTTVSAWIFAPFLLLPLVFVRKRLRANRAWAVLCLAIAFAFGTTMAIGCGGGSSGGGSTTKTQQVQMNSSATVTLTVK